MIDIDQSSQVIFLLGAGASKKAGVPTTYDFVYQFIEYEQCNASSNDDNAIQKVRLIGQIMTTLSGWKEKNEGMVDIELLLETLTKIKNRKKESLLQFCQDQLEIQNP